MRKIVNKTQRWILKKNKIKFKVYQVNVYNKNSKNSLIIKIINYMLLYKH
jgi:hypothetical protein